MTSLKQLIDSDPSNASKTPEQVRDWLLEDADPVKYHKFEHTFLGLGEFIQDLSLLNKIADGFVVAASQNSFVNETLSAARAGTIINWANPIVLILVDQTLADQADKDAFTAILSKMNRMEAAGVNEKHGVDHIAGLL